MPIRRVLLATINHDHPQRGMFQAFWSVFGPLVSDFDYLEMSRSGMKNEEINSRFIQEVLRFVPDWIWLQVQDSGILRADTILEVRRLLPRCVVTHWTGDARPQVSPYLSSISKATHLSFVSSIGHLSLFRQAGAQEAKYLQIGLDWDEDVQGNPEWSPPFRVPDVVFCGSYYGNAFPGTGDRELAIRTLIEAGVDIGIVGDHWPSRFPVVGRCHVKQQHHVWKKAKVALNVNHFNEIELYYSDRQLIAMASGTPLVCRHVPGIEREFVNLEHCIWYRSPEELVEAVRRLLSDEGLRRKMGMAGRTEVIRKHTWFSRILEVVPEVEKLAEKS